MPNNVPYVGVTRFSVVNPRGAGLRMVTKEGSDHAKYLSMLFDDERLRARFHIFGEIAAPVYQRFAENYDYRHIVQYSEELPKRWKQQLFDIAAKYPVIKLTKVTDEDMVDSVKKEVMSWGDSFRGTFVWFRVDDDDVLSVDYLEALSQFVNPYNVGMAVSFSMLASGIFVGGELGDLRLIRMPLSGLGLAFICRADLNLGSIETPGMIPHPRVDRHLPTISSAIAPHALWMRHIDQDTAVTGSHVGAKLSNLQAYFSKHPRYDGSKFASKFPTVASLKKVPAISAPVQFETAGNEWFDTEGMFNDWNDGVYVRVEWDAKFAGSVHDNVTLDIDSGGDAQFEGHFPRHRTRGDYRRLYSDSQGSGVIYMYLPKPASVRRVRVNSDASYPSLDTIVVKVAPLSTTSRESR